MKTREPANRSRYRQCPQILKPWNIPIHKETFDEILYMTGLYMYYADAMWGQKVPWGSTEDQVKASLRVNCWNPSTWVALIDDFETHYNGKVFWFSDPYINMGLLWRSFYQIVNSILDISRFRMVKIWFPQNTFFRWFFTWRAFIMVYYIIKLVLEFQFDLQNPLKQPKIWIFEKWKIIVFSQKYGFFGPKVS